MQYFVKLDVSVCEIVICIIDEKESIVFQEKLLLPNKSPYLIDRYLRSKGLKIESISLKRSALSGYIVYELSSFGWNVILAGAI